MNGKNCGGVNAGQTVIWSESFHMKLLERSRIYWLFYRLRMYRLLWIIKDVETDFQIYEQTTLFKSVLTFKLWKLKYYADIIMSFMLNFFPGYPKITVCTWCRCTVAVSQYENICSYVFSPFSFPQRFTTADYKISLQFAIYNVEAVEEKINRFVFVIFGRTSINTRCRQVDCLRVSTKRQSELIIQLNILILTRLWTFRREEFYMKRGVIEFTLNLFVSAF